MTEREEAHRRAGERLTWGPGEVMASQCASCRWKTHGVAGCAAFPSSIPEEILGNDFDPRLPWPNAEAPEDMGIRSEPRDG